MIYKIWIMTRFLKRKILHNLKLIELCTLNTGWTNKLSSAHPVFTFYNTLQEKFFLKMEEKRTFINQPEYP